jgi:2-C-methyl-D-erythritol 4-phosphate cytidylyltransferase
MHTTALLMSAGSGERFGEKLPKQFLALGGRPALIWPAQLFEMHAGIDAVAAVVPAGHEARVRDMFREWHISKAEIVVTGGATRQESVMRGLEAVKGAGGNVIVHDAVRPCMTVELLERVIAALVEHEAVVPVIPGVDTLYHLSGDEMDALVDRANIAHVQTPQGFRMELLAEAHRAAAGRGTMSSDDGSLVFALGKKVHAVSGERNNIKITFKDDVALAEALLSKRG